MTFDERWSLVQSGTPSERLQMARDVGLSGDASLLGRIQQWRATEKDSWVRRALDSSIDQLRRSGVPALAPTIWSAGASQLEVDDIRATATQNISRTLIHEARPLVTDIIFAARQEITTDYKASATAAAVNRLNEFLDTILLLNDASKSPEFIEVDLAELVAEHIRSKKYDSRLVQATRQDPVVVLGDAGLVRLLLDNAIRNALEASEDDPLPVVVNCGGTGNEAWIVVLDEGRGLPKDFPNAFEPGTTTKSKDHHFGMGLAIADQAARSLGGTIRLLPRESRGTSCEIRWRQERAD
jgi:signal transduction histidine kinase